MEAGPKLFTAEEWARTGGVARSKKLSPERRKEIAKLAAEARWKKKGSGGNGGGGGGSPEGTGGGGDLTTLPVIGRCRPSRKPAVSAKPVPHPRFTNAA